MAGHKALGEIETVRFSCADAGCFPRAVLGYFFSSVVGALVVVVLAGGFAGG